MNNNSKTGVGDSVSTTALWAEAAIDLPPRSRLYGLEPIGIGTPEVESLTGYINRLAVAHCVTVSRLLKGELYPRVKSESSPGQSQKVNGHLWLGWESANEAARMINGLGLTAERWVKVLESLTGRRNLRFLTMLDWRYVLSSQELFKGPLRWRPDCFDDYRRNDQPVYEPLLWRLYPVIACLKHQRRLRFQCSHCGCQSAAFSARSRPGHCSACGSWLGADGRDERRPEDRLFGEELKRQTWVVCNLGELLAASPTLAFPPPKEVIARFIAHNLAKRHRTSLSGLGRELGIDSTVVGQWLRGKCAMQISSLSKVCFQLNISPLQLLTEAYTIPNSKTAVYPTDSGPFPNPKVVKKRWHATAMNREILRREMEAALESELPPPSLQMIAKQLKLGTSSLLLYEPELYRQIIDRREGYFKQMRERIRQVLEKAREESPAPSLRSLAIRHGFVEATARKRFPDLYREIIERHKNYRQQFWIEVKQKLETALREEMPPPTIRLLAKRFNLSVEILDYHFSDLCGEINIRRMRYQKECAQNRHEQLLKEVRETTIKLHDRGIFPTINEVSANLPRPRYIGWDKQSVSIIRQTRKESGCE